MENIIDTQISLGSKIVDFFKQSAESAYEYGKEKLVSNVVSYFRSTPVGQKIEVEATKQTIADYLKNPIVIIVIIVIGYLIFKGLKK